jgi:hypothetical protein
MWSPTPSLPIRRSHHPLEANLSQQTINTLITATQQHPNDVILFPTTNRMQNVTCGHLRELLSYGSMTGDSIINTYLDILCNARNIHYLSTFFTSILKREKSWDAMTSWFAQDGKISPSKPKLTSDTILIPCHIQGAHWVGMVRRIINGRVTFLYADDLNLPTAETYTSPEFYPQNSIWINCTSISYRPHSNECGPRTLLALTILGIHPNPTKNILLPFMTGNLAQITRTWVAATLVTGIVNIPSLTAPTDANLSNHTIPGYLFTWLTQTGSSQSIGPTQQSTATQSFVPSR